MKIDSLTLGNFRQYYSDITIDLSTSQGKNIVLIGGKNGYGKTNLLIALVWCLYGENISLVDEHFKQEIQKESNYPKFIKQCLNWLALSQGGHMFYVEISISDINIPEYVFDNLVSVKGCIIRRSFDTNSMNETLSIHPPGSDLELFDNEEDKVNFINDYLIPTEAGKFIFFDAEKIASLAELSTKDEGTIMNDAFGKLLGLDIYKGLEEDFKIYVNNLKKEGANENVRDQITNCEKTIELNESRIEDFDQRIVQNETEIKKKKIQILSYESFINNYGKQDSLSENRDEVYNKKQALEEKAQELEINFNEMIDVIPLAILASKLDEVSGHLQIQDQVRIASEAGIELKDKFDDFVERLFNQPPELEDSIMPFKAKVFYSEKARNLFDFIFNEDAVIESLEFEHDLNNSDRELIQNAIEVVKSYSKDHFERTINDYNSVQNEIFDIDQQLRKIDANLQDDLISEYLSKKNDEELKIEKLLKENGSFATQRDELKRQNTRESQRYQSLITKVNVTQKRKQKLEKANLYISALQEFLVVQKKMKKENLGKCIYLELHKLMHKLKSEDSNFISDVKVDILPDDTGMKVTLYDHDGHVMPKEKLSTGEKQLYISCLIKAILSEAIQGFPVFIDTPLGRLDDEHIKNVLLYYYPELAEQVVILATNNEITPRRYHDLGVNISHAYLLENQKNNTIVKSGYFQGYEN